MTPETGHDNLLLTLGECKHPRGEELFSLVQRAKSRRKDETRDGRSKAQVAKESVLQFYPKASIIAYHDSIMKYALIIMSQNCICCEFLIKPSKYIFIS